MKYFYWLILILFLASFTKVSGQQVARLHGVVADSANTPLAGATVVAYWRKDSVATFSKSGGVYRLNITDTGSFLLRVSLIGYQSEERRIKSPRSFQSSLDTIFLHRVYRSLDTIIVTKLAPVILKGDTIEYRAGAFNMQTGDMVEDLLKRFPGLSVDMNGQIMAQGRIIERITVNGKDFFGTDILVATRNLPVDIVKNIQVVQDYGQQARLTGIRSGQPATILNINTRDDKKNGAFGQGTAGLGTGGGYLTNVFANEFKHDELLAFTGSANNVNTTGNAGTNTQQSMGIHYGNKWNEWLSGNGGYQFGHNETTVSGRSIQESFFPGANTLNNTSSSSVSRADNHNARFFVEYSPDKVNTLQFNGHLIHGINSIVSSNIFSILQTESLHQKSTIGEQNISGIGQTSNAGSDLLFVHRFNKSGGVISLAASLDGVNTRQDNNSLNNSTVISDNGTPVFTPIRQDIINESVVTNVNLKSSWLRPLFDGANFILAYSFSSSHNNSNRSTYNIDSITGNHSLIDSLSEQFSFLQITQQAGLGLNGKIGRLEYDFLLNCQPIKLHANSGIKEPAVNYTSISLTPSLILHYKMHRSVSLVLNYSAATSVSDWTQLRPFTDYSNPQYPVTGNPGLKPSYTHSLNIGLNRILPSGEFFSFNLLMNETQNGTVINILNNPQLVSGSPGQVIQQTTYRNASGLWSENVSYNYSKPLFHGILIAGLSGGMGYNNNISFTNNDRSLDAMWMLNQGASISCNFPKTLEFTLRGNYFSNKTIYKGDSLPHTSISSLSLITNGRCYFIRRLTMAYDLSHSFNQGFNGSISNNPTVLNLSVEYWITDAKKISAKLQCMNVLDQQTLLSSISSGNTITENQVNRMGRNFILTIIFRLNRFSGDN